MQEVVEHLRRHDFKRLFVELLGWDHTAGEYTVCVDGSEYHLQRVAHKRGLQILTCQTDRYTLFNRRLLRSLGRRAMKVAHEHVVIYFCEEPRKQVWQWAVHMPDGRRLRHREHPFFSENPPQGLTARMRGLRVTLDEEEQVTLLDALDRARKALDTKAEQNLFVNRPWYAEQSDKLARAMVAGDSEAFHRFVLFHRRLARWGARRLVRWFNLDEEDAEQIGMVAVLVAAKRFRPELGFQFSTYATRAIHQRCSRYGPDAALLIRVRPAVYWPLTRYERTAERLDARRGHGQGNRFRHWICRRRPELALRLPQFRRATDVRSLSDPTEPEFAMARLAVDPITVPGTGLCSEDVARVVRAALESIPEREADMLRRRYGFGSAPETLESLAQHYGITKEAVRQRQLRAETAMRPIVLRMLGEPRMEASPARADPSQGPAPKPRPCTRPYLTLAALAEPTLSPSTSDLPEPEIVVLRFDCPPIQRGLFAHAD